VRSITILKYAAWLGSVGIATADESDLLKVYMSDLNLCILGDGFVKGVGDPELDGWAGRLVKEANIEHGPINYYNLGVPGESSGEVAKRVRELVPRLPKGADNRLILSFGVMDTEVEEGKPKATNQESVEALKTLIGQTRSHFKMLMIGLPPVYDPQRNTRIKRLNGLYRDLCAKGRVPYIDIFAALAEDVQFKRELVKGNKIYPGQLGYQKVFDLIWNDRQWWFN